MPRTKKSENASDISRYTSKMFASCFDQVSSSSPDTAATVLTLLSGVCETLRTERGTQLISSLQAMGTQRKFSPDFPMLFLSDLISLSWSDPLKAAGCISLLIQSIGESASTGTPEKSPAVSGERVQGEPLNYSSPNERGG